MGLASVRFRRRRAPCSRLHDASDASRVHSLRRHLRECSSAEANFPIGGDATPTLQSARSDLCTRAGDCLAATGLGEVPTGSDLRHSRLLAGSGQGRRGGEVASGPREIPWLLGALAGARALPKRVAQRHRRATTGGASCRSRSGGATRAGLCFCGSLLPRSQQWGTRPLPFPQPRSIRTLAW